MVPLGQAFSHIRQATHFTTSASLRFIIKRPRCRLATCNVVLRFSGYCSVTFLVKYSRNVTPSPVTRDLTPPRISPKYDLLFSSIFFHFLIPYLIYQPNATMIVINTKLSKESGIKYFHSKLRIWSTRRRGNVHLIQSKTQTSKTINTNMNRHPTTQKDSSCKTSNDK